MYTSSAHSTRLRDSGAIAAIHPALSCRPQINSNSGRKSGRGWGSGEKVVRDLEVKAGRCCKDKRLDWSSQSMVVCLDYIEQFCLVIVMGFTEWSMCRFQTRSLEFLQICQKWPSQSDVKSLFHLSVHVTFSLFNQPFIAMAWWSSLSKGNHYFKNHMQLFKASLVALFYFLMKFDGEM